MLSSTSLCPLSRELPTACGHLRCNSSILNSYDLWSLLSHSHPITTGDDSAKPGQQRICIRPRGTSSDMKCPERDRRHHNRAARAFYREEELQSSIGPLSLKRARGFGRLVGRGSTVVSGGSRPRTATKTTKGVADRIVCSTLGEMDIRQALATLVVETATIHPAESRHFDEGQFRR